MGSRIWPAQAIRRAAAEGVISACRPFDANQIQPASLDLRLGSAAWRVPASFLPGAKRTVEQRLEDLATHRVNLECGAVLERNCVYIVPLLERVAFGPRTSARANPKSSSGRLDLFVRLITDRAEGFDSIAEGYAGPLYAEVVPRSFPVIARAAARLTQIRMRDATNDPARVARLAPLTVDLDPADKPDGIIGYRARRSAGPVNLSGIGRHRIADYWEPVRPSERRELILDPEDFYILMSAESVVVGANEAAELDAYDIAMGEMRCHYAGFADPGFGMAEAGGAGSRLVLEVRGHDVPFLLSHRQRVATLRYEWLAEVPDLLYGADLRSNYQGQGLKLSKHFA